ncbi:MAG: nitronate monooxygenase, partial [Burkholderiales bacterium]|nr:nitronate monooxygenase [Burkholderiales bacterium]
GIADADGIAAALALGAVGAQLGTAFLLTPESTITAVHRQALQTAQGRSTALTNLYSGRPARGLKNRLMSELGPISPLAPAFPTASAALAPLRAAAEQRGDEGFSPLWCGQNPSGCLPIAAAELVARLAHKHG